MVKDQSSLNMVRTKFMSTFGQDIPAQFHTYYDGLGQDALKLSLGAAQNIQLQRNDATGAAVGAPTGVDVGLWNNVNMARNSDARAAAAADRAAGLYPGQLDQQAATLEHTRASTEALGRPKPPHIMNVHPDPMGMATVPAQYDPATGQMVPVPIQGQNGTPTASPAGGMSGAPGGQMPQQGQAMGQQPQGVPAGNQGQQQGQDLFRSPTDVVDAFKAGKITREAAAKILRANRWAK